MALRSPLIVVAALAISAFSTALVGGPAAASGAASGGAAASGALPSGQVWAWGYGGPSLCGTPSTTTPTPVRALPSARQVSQGDDTTYVLLASADGTSQVVGCGDGRLGALGAGHSVTVSSAPVAVGRMRGIVQVAAAFASGYALTQDGHVWAWGYHPYLGTGQSQDAWRPVLVPGLTDIVSIAAGRTDVLALRRDGTVVGWGDNEYGQLGRPSSGLQATPAPVPGLEGVRSLVSSGSTSYAVLGDGTLLAWGLGSAGELGDGSTASRSTPAPVPGVGHVVQAAGRFGHAHALRRDGTVLTWGSCNRCLGVLGSVRLTPAPLRDEPPVTQVAEADGGGFALLEDGHVIAWGSSAAPPAGSSQATPVLVGGLSGVGSVWSGRATAFAVVPPAP